MKLLFFVPIFLLYYSAYAKNSGHIVKKSEGACGLYPPVNRNNIPDDDVIHGVHLALNTGSSLYTGHLSALQNTPEPAIGFQLGGRTNKLDYDFSCNLHWATAPQSFTIDRNDSLYSTQYKGGGYLGIDFGYQLYRKNRSELNLLFGTGLSVFDITYDSSKNYSYHSPDISAGLGYQYYFRHREFDDRETFSYIAFEARYHLLFYNNPAATSLDGNALSLTLAIGTYSTARIAFNDLSSGIGRGLMDAFQKH